MPRRTGRRSHESNPSAPGSQRGALSEARWRGEHGDTETPGLALWHRVADVVERVAAFAGDVPTLLAMRAVSHLWLGAVRHRAVAAHAVSVEVPTLPIFMSTLAFSSPRVRCDLPLADFSSDAPQSQRMFFVAMAMLCEVDAPTPEEQESNDPAVAAASDADLALDLCFPEWACMSCLPTTQLWQLRRHTRGAVRVRGINLRHGGRDSIQDAIDWLPLRSRLRWLDAESNALSATDVARLVTHAPFLECLRASAISDDTAVRELLHLHTLCIGRCDAVEPRGLASVLTMPSLRRLSLSGISVARWNTTMGVLSVVRATSPLTTLEVRGSDSAGDSCEFNRGVFPNLVALIVDGQPDDMSVADELASPKLELFASAFGDLHLMPKLKHFRTAATPGTVSEDVGRRLAALRDSRGASSLETLTSQGDIALVNAFLENVYGNNSLRHLSVRSSTGASLSAAALNAALPCAVKGMFRGVSLASDARTFFRDLRCLRHLLLTRVSWVTADENVWSSLGQAAALETLSVNDCARIPPITATVVPPTNLPLLRTVTLAKSPGMLQSEGAWSFLWGLPALSFLEAHVDAAIMATSCRALALLPSSGVRSLHTLRLGNLADAEAPAGEEYALHFARLPALRILDLFSCSRMRGASLGLLARPALLHRLTLIHMSPESQPVDIVPHLLQMTQLRQLAIFGCAAVADATPYLAPLTYACPFLRVIAIDPPVTHGLSVKVPAVADGEKEEVWRRETEGRGMWHRVSTPLACAICATEVAGE